MTRDTMPILDRTSRGESVPFALLLPFEAQAKRNHYQTLERLAERGGLSWVELVAIVEGWNLHECDMGRKPWPAKDDAKRRVLAALGIE